MLTDIFAYRYKDVTIWQTFGEPERILLVQAFKIFSEQLYPYRKDAKAELNRNAILTSIHDKLCMELGLQELSPRTWGYWTKFQGQDVWNSGKNTMDNVCKAFVCAEFKGTIPADRFMKNRISFVELAFREREECIRERNSKFQNGINQMKALSGKPEIGPAMWLDKDLQDIYSDIESMNQAFRASVDELNERFRRAGCGLNYHNGFVQQSSDEMMLKEVEKPFWGILTNEKWKNVDLDMKEAIDRRDSGVSDPALYAARALESTIKIISDEKNWTRGNEGGAAAFLDNLCNSKRGGNLIEEWEKEALKYFFAKVRNKLGHGPGSEEMPKLNPQQTDWAIETCMSWIKSLIKRM